MKMKKLVSALSALAMTVTAMAGLAVTANAETYSAPVNVTYTDKSNADTAMGYVDAAKAGYNKLSNNDTLINYSNEGWGVNYITYVKVDATQIPGTMTSAEVSFDMSGSTDSKRKATAGVAYTAYTAWDETLTYNIAEANNMRTITTVGDQVGTNTASADVFETKTVDVTDVIKNDEDKIVTFAIYATSAAGTNIKNVGVNIAYTTEQVYDVTFTETTGADITVMMGESDVTKGATLPAGHYTYTVNAEGYHPYSGEFDVVDGDVNVEFAMTAVPEAPAKTLPENAVDTTEVATNKAGSAGKEFAGYDTYGDGYTWYATMDFYLTEGGSIRYLGKTNKGNFESAGESTSIKLGTDEIRYYTGSGGTKIGDGLASGKWYTITISSDLIATLGTADSGNKLDCVITEAGTESIVFQYEGIGLRNAGNGLRYVAFDSAVNGSVAANFYSYFIADEVSEPEDTPATEVTVEGQTGVKAFMVEEFALDGTAPTWTITATPAEGEAQTKTIAAEIPTVDAQNVNLGLIVDNVPETVTVTATLGY